MKDKGKDILRKFIPENIYPDEVLPDDWEILSLEINLMDNESWVVVYVTTLPDDTFYAVKWAPDESTFEIKSFTPAESDKEE